MPSNASFAASVRGVLFKSVAVGVAILQAAPALAPASEGPVRWESQALAAPDTQFIPQIIGQARMRTMRAIRPVDERSKATFRGRRDFLEGVAAVFFPWQVSPSALQSSSTRPLKLRTPGAMADARHALGAMLVTKSLSPDQVQAVRAAMAHFEPGGDGVLPAGLSGILWHRDLILTEEVLARVSNGTNQIEKALLDAVVAYDPSLRDHFQTFADYFDRTPAWLFPKTFVAAVDDMLDLRSDRPLTDNDLQRAINLVQSPTPRFLSTFARHLHASISSKIVAAEPTEIRRAMQRRLDRDLGHGWSWQLFYDMSTALSREELFDGAVDRQAGEGYVLGMAEALVAAATGAAALAGLWLIGPHLNAFWSWAAAHPKWIAGAAATAVVAVSAWSKPDGDRPVERLVQNEELALRTPEGRTVQELVAQPEWEAYLRLPTSKVWVWVGGDVAQKVSRPFWEVLEEILNHDAWTHTDDQDRRISLERFARSNEQIDADLRALAAKPGSQLRATNLHDLLAWLREKPHHLEDLVQWAYMDEDEILAHMTEHPERFTAEEWARDLEEARELKGTIRTIVYRLSLGGPSLATALASAHAGSSLPLPDPTALPPNAVAVWRALVQGTDAEPARQAWERDGFYVWVGESEAELLDGLKDLAVPERRRIQRLAKAAVGNLFKHGATRGALAIREPSVAEGRAQPDLFVLDNGPGMVNSAGRVFSFQERIRNPLMGRGVQALVALTMHVQVYTVSEQGSNQRGRVKAVSMTGEVDADWSAPAVPHGTLFILSPLIDSAPSVVPAPTILRPEPSQPTTTAA